MRPVQAGCRLFSRSPARARHSFVICHLGLYNTCVLAKPWAMQKCRESPQSHHGCAHARGSSCSFMNALSFVSNHIRRTMVLSGSASDRKAMWTTARKGTLTPTQQAKVWGIKWARDTLGDKYGFKVAQSDIAKAVTKVAKAAGESRRRGGRKAEGAWAAVPAVWGGAPNSRKCCSRAHCFLGSFVFCPLPPGQAWASTLPFHAPHSQQGCVGLGRDMWKRVT